MRGKERQGLGVPQGQRGADRLGSVLSGGDRGGRGAMTEPFRCGIYWPPIKSWECMITLGTVYRILHRSTCNASWNYFG